MRNKNSREIHEYTRNKAAVKYLKLLSEKEFSESFQKAYALCSFQNAGLDTVSIIKPFTLLMQNYITMICGNPHNIDSV